MSIAVFMRKWERAKGSEIREPLSLDRSCRVGRPGNRWNSTEYGGRKWDVTACVRVEGRLGWDRDGEKNVMGRIEAVKMLSGRDSLS